MEYKFINTSYLESIAGNDRETITELVNIFRDQVSEFRSELRILLEGKDYLSLGLLAHKAKSSIAIMGMEDLAALLKNFELEAKESRNPEKYATYISRFESDTGKALMELDDYLKNL